MMSKDKKFLENISASRVLGIYLIRALISVLAWFSFFNSASAASCHLEAYSGQAISCVSAQPVQIDGSFLPGIKFVSPSYISPESAIDYYDGFQARAYIPVSQMDPDIRQLARELKYDPKLILGYVKDVVEYSPSFGLKKGARGAFIDREGSALDQSQLVMNLLRASEVATGISYNPRYQIGILEFGSGAGEVSKGIDWLGISDAKQLCLAGSASGLPLKINGALGCSQLSGQVNSIELLHAWVEIDVDGQTKILDPAFKEIDVGESVALPQLLDGLSKADIKASAWQAGKTKPIGQSGVSGLRVDGFQILGEELNDLRFEYAMYMGGSYADLHIDDILGFDQIERSYEVDDLPSSASYIASRDVTIAGEIPNKLRTKVKFTVAPTSASSVTLTNSVTLSGYADDLYGRTIHVTAIACCSGTGGGFARRVKLHLDGEVVLEKVITTFNDIIDTFPSITTVPTSLHFEIDHPYAADSGLFADSYIAKVASSENFFTIEFGMGQLNENRLRSYLSSGGGTGIGRKEETSASRLIATNLFTGVSQAGELLGAVNKVSIYNHHSFGIVSVPASGSHKPITMSDMEGLFTSTGITNEAVELESASREIFAIMHNGVETNSASNFYSAPTYISMLTATASMDEPNPVPSSFKHATLDNLLDEIGMENELVGFVQVTSQNVGVLRPLIFDRITTLLNCCFGDTEINERMDLSLNLMEKYVAANYLVYVPERALIGREFRAQPANTEGDHCFVSMTIPTCVFPFFFSAVKPDLSNIAMISYIHKGAVPEIPEIEQLSNFEDVKTNTAFGVDQISLKTGEFSYELPMLSVGNLSASIVKQEGYEGTNLEPRVTALRSPTIAYGSRRIEDVAGVMVGIHAATKLLSDDNADMGDRLLAHYAMGRFANSGHNVLDVQLPSEGISEQLTSLFDEDAFCVRYFPNPNSALVSGACGEFPTSSRYRYPSGKTVSFQGSPEKYFSNSTGEVTLPEYKISSFVVTDPAGTFREYTYKNWTNPEWESTPQYPRKVYGWEVENELGHRVFQQEIKASGTTGVAGRQSGIVFFDDFNRRSEQIRNLELNAKRIIFPNGDEMNVKLEYERTNHSANSLMFTDTKVWNGLNQLTMDVDYSSLGSSTRVVDGSGRATEFFIAPGWRGEKQDENGNSYIEYFDERGQTTVIVEPELEGASR